MDPVLPSLAKPNDDSGLVERLRARDEAALKVLLARYHRATVRLAGAFARSEAVAEEVAQDAWIAVVQGIDGFKGQSSFRAWLFQIVSNIAKRRALREARSVPLSALGADDDADEPAVDPSRFNASGRWVGHWSAPPEPWGGPEERLLAGEARTLICKEIEALPPLQRQVITIRDIEGCTSEEACAILGITEANQRVLLHRARSRVRRALEAQVGRWGSGSPDGALRPKPHLRGEP
jgi:RNA polymerase sigma-70 factor (ECF subfamily)